MPRRLITSEIEKTALARYYAYANGEDYGLSSDEEIPFSKLFPSEADSTRKADNTKSSKKPAKESLELSSNEIRIIKAIRANDVVVIPAEDAISDAELKIIMDLRKGKIVVSAPVKEENY